MKQTITASEFFNESYVDQASYDNMRKIASVADGLKNSSRKVICTVLDKKIYSPIKVQQLSAKTSEYTDYLHGSLDGVVVTLGQEYTGSNQLPLIKKKGNFGTRAIPEASASRYIFAAGSEWLSSVFLSEDRDILPEQYFEGAKIEPRFFIPSLPILLVNGNHGVSSGFSQLVEPRKLESLVDILKQRLNGKIKTFTKVDDLDLYYRGFAGTVKREYSDDSNYRWAVYGEWERNGRELIIKELPIDTNIQSYTAHLDTLVGKKVIKTYKDQCDGDNLQYTVIFTTQKELSKMDDEKIVTTFKLRSYITENFTSLDENNKIVEYSKASEIMEHYYRLRLDMLEKRRQLLLQQISERILRQENIIRFITLVNESKTGISKLKSDELIQLLETKKFDKIDGNYQYLLSLPMVRLTVDKANEIKVELENLKSRKAILEDMTVEEMWLNDLDKLKGLKF